MKQNFLNDNIKPILAIMVVGLTFTYFFYCGIRDLKPDPQILIAVVGSVTIALQYYFGNSQGSSKKDEAIATMANNAAPTVTNADTVNVNQGK